MEKTNSISSEKIKDNKQFLLRMETIGEKIQLLVHPLITKKNNKKIDLNKGFKKLEEYETRQKYVRVLLLSQFMLAKLKLNDLEKKAVLRFFNMCLDYFKNIINKFEDKDILFLKFSFYHMIKKNNLSEQNMNLFESLFNNNTSIEQAITGISALVRNSNTNEIELGRCIEELENHEKSGKYTAILLVVDYLFENAELNEEQIITLDTYKSKCSKHIKELLKILDKKEIAFIRYFISTIYKNKL